MEHKPYPCIARVTIIKFNIFCGPPGRWGGPSAQGGERNIMQDQPSLSMQVSGYQFKFALRNRAARRTWASGDIMAGAGGRALPRLQGAGRTDGRPTPATR